MNLSANLATIFLLLTSTATLSISARPDPAHLNADPNSSKDVAAAATDYYTGAPPGYFGGGYGAGAPPEFEGGWSGGGGYMGGGYGGGAGAPPEFEGGWSGGGGYGWSARAPPGFGGYMGGGYGGGGYGGGGGGYGWGYGGSGAPPGGRSEEGRIVRPSVVCEEKGACYMKKLKCPARCFYSFHRSGEGYGYGGGGGGCTLDCTKCVAYC